MGKIIGIDLGTTNRYRKYRRIQNNTICCSIHKDR